jgi:hypothetical protein
MLLTQLQQRMQLEQGAAEPSETDSPLPCKLLPGFLSCTAPLTSASIRLSMLSTTVVACWEVAEPRSLSAPSLPSSVELRVSTSLPNEAAPAPEGLSAGMPAGHGTCAEPAQCNQLRCFIGKGQG